ncbi:MAG: ABC transporter substrate-binding protein, partial [Prevotella sp.]|nr:ABC transporter substrate-binding protein [Prevotella sp.]
MKRNYFIIIFSVIVTMLLASCGDGKSETEKLAAAEKAADSLALKIAVLPTLDCLPVYVAKELSLFDKQDIDVRLKKYSAHMDCDTALT